MLHDELNNQNKALLLRVRELIDAGDTKDNRIRELEAQLRNKEGDPYSKSCPDTALQLLVAEYLTYLPLTFCRGYSEGGIQQVEIKIRGTGEDVRCPHFGEDPASG